MPKVDIFWSQMCTTCQYAKDYFNEKGILYNEYEVKWKDGTLLEDDNGRELKNRLSNVEFVPQIFINDIHIGGWNKLNELIQSGEIDKILFS